MPYTPGKLSWQTVTALADWGGYYVLAGMAGPDIGAYSRLLLRLLEIGETFVICEEDVVPTPGQLTSVTTCGHEWCYFEYENGPYPKGYNLGLARFGATLMAKYPHMARDALVTGARRDEECPWWSCDAAIHRNLTIRGAHPVTHGPPVYHDHPHPATPYG